MHFRPYIPDRPHAQRYRPTVAPSDDALLPEYRFRCVFNDRPMSGFVVPGRKARRRLPKRSSAICRPAVVRVQTQICACHVDIETST